LLEIFNLPEVDDFPVLPMKWPSLIMAKEINSLTNPEVPLQAYSVSHLPIGDSCYWVYSFQSGEAGFNKHGIAFIVVDGLGYLVAGVKEIHQAGLRIVPLP